MTQNQTQAQVNMLRTYLKGASLEHPAAPQAFLDDSGAPIQDKLDIQVKVEVVAAGVIEMAVRATLELARDNKTMLLLEVEHAGLCQLTNVPAEDVDAVLAIHVAPIVYGALRVNFADLMTRAALPPMYLPEVNWVEQHQNRLAQLSQPAGRTAAAAND